MFMRFGGGGCVCAGSLKERQHTGRSCVGAGSRKEREPGLATGRVRPEFNSIEGTGFAGPHPPRCQGRVDAESGDECLAELARGRRAASLGGSDLKKSD
eukprot:3528304-Prymnesium_polylepis.2